MNPIRRLLIFVFPFFATSCKDVARPTGDIQMVDPKDLLFSLPTLCDPAPAVDESPVLAGARALHEDDWRQIEFVSMVGESHIRGELATLAAFRIQYRRASGWASVYLRKEHPDPLHTLGLRFSTLPTFPSFALTLSGRPVRGGFALSDGSDWFIYGQRSPEGRVIQLAVSPGLSTCSEEFAQGLVQITESAGVMLVDWYAGAVVDVTSSRSVSEWALRYAAQ